MQWQSEAWQLWLARADGSCTDWSNLRYTGRIYDFRRYIFGLEMDRFGNQLETIPYTCYTMYLIALFHAMVQKIASREHAHNCSWEKLANC